MNKDLMETHALRVGKIIGNLQMIEMAARMALVKLDKYKSSQVVTDLSQVKENDVIELNAFTDKSDLRQTLQKYNKKVVPEFKVNINKIVSLRDALAHGRVFGCGHTPFLRLLKFNRDTKNNKVKVDMSVEITPDWLISQIDFLMNEYSKVIKALDYKIVVLQ